MKLKKSMSNMAQQKSVKTVHKPKLKTIFQRENPKLEGKSDIFLHACRIRTFKFRIKLRLHVYTHCTPIYIQITDISNLSWNSIPHSCDGDRSSPRSSSSHTSCQLSHTSVLRHSFLQRLLMVRVVKRCIVSCRLWNDWYDWGTEIKGVNIWLRF